MNENRPCKKELLEWINIVSFAVDDVKLFLDTHPNCPEALEFFDEFKKQIIWLAVSIFIMFIVTFINYEVLVKISPIFWTSNTGYCKYTYGLLEMDQ